MKNIASRISKNEIDPNWAWESFKPDQSRPWNQRLAAHLYRRAAFSASPMELEQATSSGCDKTLDRLFDLESALEFNRQMDDSSRYLVTGGEVRRLSSWWLLRMLNSPAPLLEKMTLFWHGHFATSGAKVTEAAAMLQQNDLLRKHALGLFEPMVQGISSDVAMLTYLDSTDNRRTRPNENYARELLELFCLGLDNYTETDVKELARCFTGWEVKKISGAAKFEFNSRQHDTGRKTLLGSTGEFGGEQAVKVILANPVCAEFIASKLIRYFVFDEAELPRKLIAPVANVLRESNYDINKTVRTILSSNLFFSDHAIGQKIRGPVEMAIGFLRQFDATTNMEQLLDQLELLGQLPLYPPNVKGWDGGRKWLNASTLLARANLLKQFSGLEIAKLQTETYAAWLNKNDAPSGSSLVNWILGFVLAHDIPDQSKKALEEIAGISRDQHETMKGLLTAIAVLPEFQLN